MTYKEIENINNRLFNLTWITIAGDFISLFAFATLIGLNSHNFITSGLAISIKAGASIFGAFIYPKLFNRFGARKLISISQLIPFFSSIFIAMLVFQKTETKLTLGICLFIESALSICFLTVRTSFPKFISDLCSSNNVDQVMVEKLTTRIDKAQTLGMFIGCLFFFIVQFFLKIPMSTMLVINAMSFLVSFFISLKIPNIKVPHKLQLFGSIRKILTDKKIAAVFFIRTLGLWPPISLFNSSMYDVTYRQYHLDTAYFALIGSCVAIGAIYTSDLLSSNSENRLSKMNLTKRGILGGVLFFISMILLALSTNQFLGAGILGLNGAANALLVNASRGLLSNSTSSKENGEILNLDSLFGKILDISVSLLFVFLGSKMNWAPSIALNLAAFWIVIVLIPPFFLLLHLTTKEVDADL